MIKPSGIFIFNDFMILATRDENGNIDFLDYEGGDRIYLYFHFDKSKTPPFVIDKNIRSIYYSDKTSILGDYLKYIDKKNEDIICNKEFNTFSILKIIINHLFSKYSSLLSEKLNGNYPSPFYLIFPPNIGLRAKQKTIESISKKRNIVRFSDYLYPYIFQLLSERKISSSGRVLFIEMTVSDVYIYLIKTTYIKQKYKIEIEENEELIDIEIEKKLLEIIAKKIVETAARDYYSPIINDYKRFNNEILKKMQLAVEVLNGFKKEAIVRKRVLLSDNRGGLVVIRKDDIQGEFDNVLHRLEKTINKYIHKYDINKIILFGDKLENQIVVSFFENNYTKERIIKHNEDNYKLISKLIFEQNEDVRKIDIKELNMGQIISLCNYNDDPNKGNTGPAEQELKYIGKKLFEVIRSSRTLEHGMKIKSVENVWKHEMRLKFEVIHIPGINIKDQIKGNSIYFTTRPIKRIELKKWLM